MCVFQDGLKVCLKQRAPKLMSHRPLRLIIIDSIAGVFRTYLENGAINRARELREVAKQLTKLSVKHHAAIICVNQVIY
jgi:predicted ATP-dependent serine protease